MTTVKDTTASYRNNLRFGNGNITQPNPDEKESG